MRGTGLPAVVELPLTCLPILDDIDSFELEDFLVEIMSAEFNTLVDDNSLSEVPVFLNLHVIYFKIGNCWH